MASRSKTLRSAQHPSAACFLHLLQHSTELHSPLHPGMSSNLPLSTTPSPAHQPPPSMTQKQLVVMCSMKAGLRVKSISMGKFSPEEVKQLEEGGNEVAASKYLAKWKAEGDARRPNSKNHMAVEAWVLTVLVDKRYYSDSPASPATSSPGSQGQGSSHIPVRPMSELLGASQVKLQVGSTAQGQGQSKTGPPPSGSSSSSSSAVTAGPPPAAAVQGSAAAMASVGSAALSGASTTSDWGAFEGAGALSLAGLGLQDTGAASGGALGASAPAEVKIGSQAGLGPPAGGSGSSSSNLVALTQQQQQQQAALLGPSSMDWGAFTTDSVDSSSVSQTPAAAPAPTPTPAPPAAPAPTPAPAPPAAPAPPVAPAPAPPAAPAPAKPGALTVREELPSDLFSIPALSPGPAAPPGPGPAATASHPAAPPHHHPWQPPQQPWQQQQQQQTRHSTGAWPQSMAQPLPSQGPMQLSPNWGNPPQAFHPPPPPRPAAPHLHSASQPPAVIATYPGSTLQPPHPFLPHQPLQQAAGLVGSWAAGAGWAGGVGGGVGGGVHAGSVAPGHPPSFHPAAGTPGPVAVAANGAAPAAWSLGPAAGFPGGLAQGLHPAHGPALNVGRATHGAGSDAASSFGLFQAASPPQLAKPVLGSGPAVSGSSPPARSGAAPAARSSQDTFADLFTSSAGPPAAAGFAGQSGNPFA
ncbi:hypothetical protein QJQ45_008026 [Haematococcus lacustris]|nr:hypothetical protein QJQ45_008026 [Haematococcus lacustris]